MGGNNIGEIVGEIAFLVCPPPIAQPIMKLYSSWVGWATSFRCPPFRATFMVGKTKRRFAHPCI